MASYFSTMASALAGWSRAALRPWRGATEIQRRILEQRIATMYGRMPAGLAMSLAVAAILTFILPAPGGRGPLLAWGAANVLLAAARLLDHLACAKVWAGVLGGLIIPLLI